MGKCGRADEAEMMNIGSDSDTTGYERGLGKCVDGSSTACDHSCVDNDAWGLALAWPMTGV